MTQTTPRPLPTGYAAALTDFTRRYPDYAAHAHLDALRATDYARLDRTGHVYLDYTGGGLYAESQLRKHHELLANNVFGNPHSQNPTSLAMTHLVEEARAYVLHFFNADPAEYTVIFTPNASGALKLVGESYPFAPGGRYALLYDNHNSVNGIREFARARGAAVSYIPVSLPDLRAPTPRVLAVLATADRAQPNLFAFPAQSNFSGVQHPLEWAEAAHAHGWDVLLDGAAFTPTNRLDLSRVKPDFVPLSFYKIFGYPTGVGALLVRHHALAKLRRPWFAGGTITITSVQGEGWHSLIPGAAGFEDGTVNYLNLPAVEIGLRHIEAIGIDAIHARVMALTGWLLEQMTALAHSSGAPLVHIFGPTQTEARGGTIAFTLRDPTGEDFDFRRIEAAAAERLISLRTGCFCNPGDGEVAHSLTRAEMACYFTGAPPSSFYEFYDLLHVATGKTPSTLRISLGVASNFADVYAFVGFLREFCDRRAADLPWAPEPTLAAVRQRDAA
ncbi:MAG TPA: aminotransferase [Chloroflexi bacterium]|nr:aminotransferase [Chloroflexota bacterium]HHW87320.1 aminotransferase class V-fold PLP-dependent enzyme [Chloroflexota bacterium]